MRTLTLLEVESVNGGLAVEARNLQPALIATQLGDFTEAHASPTSTLPVVDASRLTKPSSNSSQMCTPPHQTASWDGHALKVKDSPGYCVGGSAY